jgi:hypothetical protein
VVVRTTYSWQSNAVLFLCLSVLEPQSTEDSEIIVPDCGFWQAWTRLAANKAAADSRRIRFIGDSSENWASRVETSLQQFAAI